MTVKPSNWIPLHTALTWIFLSVLAISGSSYLALLYYKHLRELCTRDDKYRIVAIVQTTPNKESLKTTYLAELLDLSIDHPTNLYRFHSKEAKAKLLSSPIIKEATVKKILPGTVYVDYTLREPIAFLGDYTNVVVDAEGYVFPFKPFFTPKKLPEIYLGETLAEQVEGDSSEEKKWHWEIPLKGKKIELALSLLDFITTTCCDDVSYLCRIDVSHAYALSYGQRQIVVIMEDRMARDEGDRSVFYSYPRILRLNTENYVQQLANYLVLREYLREQEAKKPMDTTSSNIKVNAMIIDLRVPQLAFIANEKYTHRE
jgi:POTRA domain, FtsQ-type